MCGLNVTLQKKREQGLPTFDLDREMVRLTTSATDLSESHQQQVGTVKGVDNITLFIPLRAITLLLGQALCIKHVKIGIRHTITLQRNVCVLNKISMLKVHIAIGNVQNNVNKGLFKQKKIHVLHKMSRNMFLSWL